MIVSATTILTLPWKGLSSLQTFYQLTDKSLKIKKIYLNQSSHLSLVRTLDVSYIKILAYIFCNKILMTIIHCIEVFCPSE